MRSVKELLKKVIRIMGAVIVWLLVFCRSGTAGSIHQLHLRLSAGINAGGADCYIAWLPCMA